MRDQTLMTMMSAMKMSAMTSPSGRCLTVIVIV